MSVCALRSRKSETKSLEKFFIVIASAPRSHVDWSLTYSAARIYSSFNFSRSHFATTIQNRKSRKMARRRTKKRTHVGAKNGPQGSAKPISANQVSREPKSMVIRIGAGEVGPSVSQLVKDVRLMMEPGTASRLKERRSNRLKDYLTMAGPLGVSHLMLFSRSESGNTNLRLAITPRGPTLHFRVEKYSLCKDVKKALKHPKGGGKEYLTAPLVCSPEPGTSCLC